MIREVTCVAVSSDLPIATIIMETKVAMAAQNLREVSFAVQSILRIVLSFLAHLRAGRYYSAVSCPIPFRGNERWLDAKGNGLRSNPVLPA